MTEATVLITTGVGADNCLFNNAPTSNSGTTVLNNVSDVRKPTVRFDLSAIPAGATCTSAVLKFYHYNNSGVNNTYRVFKISDANGDWVEGTKALTQAGAGEPCWNAKEANGSGGVTTAWAGSAGLSSAGTDYVNTVLAEASTPGSITANAALDFTFNADGLAVIASWFGQATNNGLLIVRTSGSNVGSFHTKDATTAGYRPVLVVNYEAIILDELTATDLTLSPVTFDAPVLEDGLLLDNLTGLDFTLSPVTFDAPVLTVFIITPPERTYTVDAESREYVIPADSREYVIDKDMRGLKIEQDHEYKYPVGNIYDALTGKDFTLARPTFDSPLVDYWLMNPASSVQYAGSTTLNSDALFAVNYTVIPGSGAINQRVRQHGYIKSVTLRTTETSVVKFKIFRPSGTDYTFIGESEQVTYQAGTTTQNLSTPIECIPGDLLGVYVASGKLSATALTNGALIQTGDISATWSGGTASNYYPSITGFGIEPYLAVTGDSLAVGHNLWFSLYEAGPAGSLTSEPWYVLRGLVNSSQSGGFEYQNHAKGSQVYTWVLSTGIVSALATGARAILIHCGINDIARARAWNDVLGELNSIKALFAASTSARKLVIDEILPWTAGDDTQAGTVRTWNANLAAWVAANNDISGKTIMLAEIHDLLGQTRVSTGELDDLLTAYNSGDGVHLSAAGYAKMAELLQPYIPA